MAGFTVAEAQKDSVNPSKAEAPKDSANSPKNEQASTADKKSSPTKGPKISSAAWTFIMIQGIFLVLVFFLYPLICKRIMCCKKNDSIDLPPLKGLNLPEGSVRAMIAIAIIGSFLIILSIGPLVFKNSDHFNTILAAFGSLSGAVLGFYFGSRGSEQKKLSDNREQKESNKNTNKKNPSLDENEKQK